MMFYTEEARIYTLALCTAAFGFVLLFRTSDGRFLNFLEAGALLFLASLLVFIWAF